MSTPQPDQPDWGRLPHDPQGFFGLAEPIDRKELKRAYNRLLRRFKPEKAPEEFQKIRAAYEALDEQLRYGDQATTRFSQTIKWDELGEPANHSAFETTRTPRADQPQAERPPKRKSLAERLDSEPPLELYNELKLVERKSPFEYYALALLSDIVERDKPLRFAEWLLTGIKNHPEDGALWRLLHEYLRGPLPAGSEAKLLQAVARVASGDSFYPLTEPVWLRVLRSGHGELAVENFAKLLAACESKLRDTQIAGKMTFYIQLAKAAMLVGDHPWPQQTIDYIEANFEQAPPWMEQDIDMLGLLSEYAAHRRAFVAGGPLCKQIDAALHDYFLLDQSQGDRAVVAAQIVIAENLDGLLAAFPLDRNHINQVVYPLWMWVSYDVAERNAPPEPEQTGPQPNWQSRVIELVKRLGDRANNSKTGIVWTVLGLGYRCLQTAILLGGCIGAFWAGAVSWPALVGEDNTFLSTLLSIPQTLIAGFFGWKLCGWMTERYWNDYCGRTSAKLYESSWRAEIIQFQQRSHLDGQEFRLLFAQSVNDDLALSDYINAYVQQDYAPAILSVGQRFLA